MGTAAFWTDNYLSYSIGDQMEKTEAVGTRVVGSDSDLEGVIKSGKEQWLWKCRRIFRMKYLF